MKLRIRGNSIRLRLAKSEVVKLVDDGSIEETVFFSADGRNALKYGVRHQAGLNTPILTCDSSSVFVELPTTDTRRWAEGDETGIYSEIDLRDCGTLRLMVEKDFACLDLSDAENADTFPNPAAGSSC